MALQTNNTVIQKYKVVNFLAFVAVLLLVVLPKGGIKIAGVPLTWGYIYLGILSLVVLANVTGRYRFNKSTLLCFFAVFPFLIYFFSHLSVFGYDGTVGNLISFFVSFAFLPFLFLVLLAAPLKRIDLPYLEKLITKAVIIVSVYGIILFLFRQITGSYIEIPYITVNAADVGTLGSKHNMRGNISKLISTYNNGNIFGVCMLMLFPVFYKNCKKNIWIVVVCLALFLTLSRTVWIGMVLFFLIKYRHKLLKLLKIYISVIALVIFLSPLVFTRYFQYGSLGNFLLDTNFGGRLNMLQDSAGISLFGTQTFEVLEEVVYASVYRQLGFIGLIIFAVYFFAPLIVYKAVKFKNSTYFTGVVIYWVLCWSDGCMPYLPTLAFYNFILCMTFVTSNRLQKQQAQPLDNPET